jgi:hypothetical protein
MSIGSLSGLAASIAGIPLAQTKGSEIDRAQQDASAQQRVAQSDQKAESAAGIGETNGEDHEASERDADGRLPWRMRQNAQDTTEPAAASPPASKDTSGQSGNLLDLNG